MILSDEIITGVVEEEGFADDILQVLMGLQNEKSAFNDVTVEVHSRTIYDEILEASNKCLIWLGNDSMEFEALVNTKL